MSTVIEFPIFIFIWWSEIGCFTFVGNPCKRKYSFTLAFLFMGTFHILGWAVIHGAHLPELGNEHFLNPTSINILSSGIFWNNSLFASLLGNILVSFVSINDVNTNAFINMDPDAARIINNDGSFKSPEYDHKGPRNSQIN